MWDITSKITKGTTPTTLGRKFVSSGINFIKAESITDDSRFIPSKFEHIDIETNNALKRSIIQENDILYSIAGVIGRPALVNGEILPANTNQALAIIRPNLDKVEPKYLFYLLSSKMQRRSANNLVAQSAQPNINLEQVSNFEFQVPILEEQKRIAEILSAFDEKIENNNRIIKTLEEMAQTIFKEWFVKFRFPGHKKTEFVDSELGEIPKEWEVKKILDIARVVLGGTPSRNNPLYWNGKIPWINSGEVNNLRVIEPSEYITEAGLKKSNASLMPAGTTLIAITGATLGQVSLLEIKACANQSVVGIYDPKGYMNEFLYLYIQTNIQEIISHATGGAQQHINKRVIEDFKILLPNEKVLFGFQMVVQPIFQRLSNLVFENQKLAAMRDLLLPRLMIGEIRV